MEVGVWKDHVDDDIIFEMLFKGLIKDYDCPHCGKSAESDPNDTTVTCDDCGEEFYVPIYDPSIGL